MEQSRDRNGAVVKVGSRVRVLAIRPSVLAPLDADEIERLQSMKGEVFEVYEVDPFGGAWVVKWWHLEGGNSLSHSLSLAPAEMEVEQSGETNAA
jgi:hypothetical protein